MDLGAGTLVFEARSKGVQGSPEESKGVQGSPRESTKKILNK